MPGDRQKIMDIKQLSSLVRELVLDADEVLVPGLGTFRAEVVPASFSDKGYTVNPPYRKLAFVAEELPEAKPIEAEGLAELVERLKKDLQETRSVELPGLGKLRLTKGDKYFFVADEDANIFPDGFGLEPVSLKNKGGHSQKSKKGKAENDAEGKPTKDDEIIKAIWIIVGIIIVAMIVLRLLGTFVPDFIDKILYTPEELEIIHGGL